MKIFIDTADLAADLGLFPARAPDGARRLLHVRAQGCASTAADAKQITTR